VRPKLDKRRRRPAPDRRGLAASRSRNARGRARSLAPLRLSSRLSAQSDNNQYDCLTAEFGWKSLLSLMRTQRASRIIRGCLPLLGASDSRREADARLRLPTPHQPFGHLCRMRWPRLSRFGGAKRSPRKPAHAEWRQGGARERRRLSQKVPCELMSLIKRCGPSAPMQGSLRFQRPLRNAQGFGVTARFRAGPADRASRPRRARSSRRPILRTCNRLSDRRCPRSRRPAGATP
jgi:hypothetical protein